jgi:TatD DNase family protein
MPGKVGMKIFDSHCHLDDEAYDIDRDDCIGRAGEQGVIGILNPGYDLSSSLSAIRMAGMYENVWAAVGIHPQKGEEHNPESLESLNELVSQNKVVAIGEIGLDYYWMKSPKQAQHEAFLKQLGIASRLGLPALIHSRDAAQETFDIVREHRKSLPGLVMHCYSGSPEMAIEYVKLDCMISLAGPVTFNNARRAQEVAARIPLSHLLVETDGPYLAPMPHRGKRNEPAYTRLVAEKLALIKGISIEEVAASTYQNTVRLLKIQPGNQSRSPS